MQRVAVFLILTAALGCSTADTGPEPRFDVSGRLENAKIREASGLARSFQNPGTLWLINDNGGKEWLHAIGQDGSRLGEIDLKKAKNKDWEDLAAFELDGEPYLMVADIGDNDARRPDRTLYFVAEPSSADELEVKRDWETDFVYSDGPRDAEAAAVDIDNQHALILSKRDLPPRLYAVPLKTQSKEPATAEFLGTIDSLRKPTRLEVEYAPKVKDWFWQPVGMDISNDNRAAVILSYREAFYFERRPEQSWLQALNGRPLVISLGNFENAEAIAFADTNRTVIVTGENKHSRILRIDLADVASRDTSN